MRYRFLLLIVALLTFLPSYSQNAEYNSVNELLNDIYSRNYEKPITFMRHYLSSVENGTEVFQDSIYIGIASLLMTSYVQNNQIHDADTLMTHIVQYMTNTGKKTNILYQLYIARGSILCSLGNYNGASVWISSALDMIKVQKGKEEEQSVILSMLASCHMNMNELESAKKEIEEAITIIERSNSDFSLQRKITIYQNAGAIYHEVGIPDKMECYTKKAYELVKDNEMFVSEFIKIAHNLAVLYLNTGKYNESLTVLHEIEKKPLSEEERSEVYESIFLGYYYLNNEDETVKYANLCCNSIKAMSSDLYSSFPALTIEKIWDKNAMRLKVNMGILSKFHNNAEAVEMCYDNVLFVKGLALDNMSRLRKIIHNDSIIGNLYSEVKKLKSEAMTLTSNSTIYNTLDEKEKLLQERILEHNKKDNINFYLPTWKQVWNTLRNDEYAIEFITYSGFIQSDSKSEELKYAALILSPKADQPFFVELCTVNELKEMYIKALREREIGINGLYLRNQDFILYKLIWEKLDYYVNNAKTIYVSPILGLKDINIGFIPCPDGCYLIDKYDIRIVTSTAEICNREKIAFSDAYVYGGIEYSVGKKESNQSSYRSIIINEVCDSTRNGFGFLQASNYETEQISNILKENRIKTSLYNGSNADEYSFRGMDEHSSSILHLSTHGFYLVGTNKYQEYFTRFIPYLSSDSCMLLSGILLANSNPTIKSVSDSNALNDGVLTAEEISYLDLSNTKLLVLSACETAIGQDMKEGFGGLVKAFKNAGVKSILASLWRVSDVPTANLMISFYKYLMGGEDIHSALLKAQKEISKQYPDPYYWAGFVIID